MVFNCTIIKVLMLAFALVAAQPAFSETLVDIALEKVVRIYNLRPLPTKPFELDPKFKLGRFLFFDPIMSGNRSVACSTCHVLGLSTTDK